MAVTFRNVRLILDKHFLVEFSYFFFFVEQGVQMTTVVLRTIGTPEFPAKCIVCEQAWNKYVPILVESRTRDTPELKHIAVPVCSTCRLRFKSTPWPEGCISFPVIIATIILSNYLFENYYLRRLFIYIAGILFFIFTKRQIEGLRSLDISIENSAGALRFRFKNDQYAKQFAEMNSRQDNSLSVDTEIAKPFQFRLFTLFAITIAMGIEIPLVLWIVRHIELDRASIFGLIVFGTLPLIFFGALIEAFLREAERQRRWPNP